MTNESCHLGAVGKATFNSCIKDANEKQKNININIILNNQIFKEFSKKYLKKYYYNLFVNLRYEFNNKVIIEGLQADNIYFIKNGDFHITFKKSLIEICNYIKFLGGTLKNQQDIRERISDSPSFQKYMNEKKIYRVSYILIRYR